MCIAEGRISILHRAQRPEHALQVEEAAGRVAKLRGEVPAALSQHFRARLQACRPLARSAAPDAVAAQDGDAALPEALSPAPAELRGKLSDAATQLPILRCACLPDRTAPYRQG